MTSPADALALARRHYGDGLADVAAQLATHEAEMERLAELTKTEALGLAFEAIGSHDAPEAITWLAQRGVTVSATHAHKIAREGAHQAIRTEAAQGDGGAPPALGAGANGQRPDLRPVDAS